MRNCFVSKWWVAAVVLVVLVVLWRRAERLLPSQNVAVPQDSRDNPPATSAAASPRSTPSPQESPSIPAATNTDPYGMPPPSPDQIRPLPEAHIATPQEHQQTHQAARELVASGIVRLENEGRRAEQTGDKETAQRNQIRVARLRKRLAALDQQSVPAAEEK